MSVHEKTVKIVDLLIEGLEKTKMLALESVIEEESRNNLISKFKVARRQIQSMHDFSSRIRSFEELIVKEFIKLDKSIESIESMLKLNDRERLDEKLEALIKDISSIEETISSRKLPACDQNVDGASKELQQHTLQVLRPPSDEWLKLKDSEELKMGSALETFQVSYQSLRNFKLKLCLLCFSIFPEKCVIKKRIMIYWWLAEGLASSDNEGDEIFRDLMEKGLIMPVREGNGPLIKNRCTLRPWIRRTLISVAEEAGFYDFVDTLMTQNHIPIRRALILRGNRSLTNNNDIKEESLTMVFNLENKYLSFGNEWLPKLKKLTILQLGRWQDSPKHHIEIDNDESLNELKTQKHLKYLSLRGISRITKLPRSITKLVSLEILDLRACHNLEKLPSDISMLKNLTHLDISECYLLESMPKGLDRLPALSVLKGFVIGSNAKTSCQVSDLVRLKKLSKLSIYIRAKAIIKEKEFEKLEEIESLLKLTISWGRDSRETGGNRITSITFPERLYKLDLRCAPEEETPAWLDPIKLPELKKLYIRGGSLRKFTNAKWKLEVLRLKYLENFSISDQDLREVFPDVVYLEISRCSRQQRDIFWNKDEDNKAITIK